MVTVRVKLIACVGFYTFVLFCSLFPQVGVVCALGYVGFRIAWHFFGPSYSKISFSSRMKSSNSSDIASRPDHEKILAVQELVADIVQFETSYSSHHHPPLTSCIVVPYSLLAQRNGLTKQDIFNITVAVYEKFIENTFNQAGGAKAGLVLPIRTDTESYQATLEEMFEEGYELFRWQLQAKSAVGKTSVADIETRKIAVSTFCQEVIGGLFVTPGLISSQSDLNVSSFF